VVLDAHWVADKVKAQEARRGVIDGLDAVSGLYIERLVRSSRLFWHRFSAQHLPSKLRSHRRLRWQRHFLLELSGFRSPRPTTSSHLAGGVGPLWVVIDTTTISLAASSAIVGVSADVLASASWECWYFREQAHDSSRRIAIVRFQSRLGAATAKFWQQGQVGHYCIAEKGREGG